MSHWNRGLAMAAIVCGLLSLTKDAAVAGGSPPPPTFTATPIPTTDIERYSVTVIGMNDNGALIGTYTPQFQMNHGFVGESGKTVDVGLLPGFNNCQLVAINDSGTVLGNCTYVNQNSIGGLQPSQPFTWVNGVMTALPMLPSGLAATATGMNASGTVVGLAYDKNERQHAVMWQGGAITDLGLLPGAPFQDAQADCISPGGLIAGTCIASDDKLHIFVWNSGTMQDFGTYGAGQLEPTFINDNGQFAGFYQPTSSSPDFGFEYSGGTFTGFDTVPGAPAYFDSGVRGMNASGEIAGGAFDSSFNEHAFVYNAGTITDLGLMGGNPYGINDAGQIVGQCETPSFVQEAFVWQNGTTTILPDLVANENTYGMTINASGQVGGESTGSDNFLHPVLWTSDVIADLGELQATPSTMIGMNDSGQAIITTQGNPSGNGYLYNGGTLTPIPNFGRGAARPIAINASGTVMGSVELANTAFAPFIFANGALVTPSGSLNNIVTPERLNDAGQVAGIFLTGSGAHPFLWAGTAATPAVDLAPFVSGGSTFGNISVGGLNNNGQICGVMNDTAGDSHAYLWTNGTVTDIQQSIESTFGSQPNNSSSATAINDAGMVAGTYQTNIGPQGFLYQNGVVTNLGAITPVAIDQAGDVLGTVQTFYNNTDEINVTVTETELLPFGGTVENLGDLGSLLGVPENAVPVAMDPAFDVIGNAQDPVFSFNDPYLWTGGTMYNLNTQTNPVPGLVVESPVAITSNGQTIAANGIVNGVATAMLLQAKPVDTTPPVTTIQLTGTAGNSPWYTSAVTVTLNATDDSSGVASTFYTVDGGAQQTYSAPFVVSGDGAHTVQYWSVDKAGNVETTHSKQIQIDTTPPFTSATPSGTLGGGGWYRSNVSVSLSAADATSGVATTVYSIDGAPQQTYASPFSVSGDGVHTVTYQSVDVAGNTESTETSTIKIDTTPPVPNATVDIITAGFGGFTLTLGANDGASGVAAIYYTINGGAQQTYSAPVTVTITGGYSIVYWASDVAGNVSNQVPLTINIPSPVPVLKSLSKTASPANTALTETVTGSNFVQSSVLELSGVPLATTYVSSTSIKATVPASAVGVVGTFPMAVFTPAPGGGTSKSITFTVTAPALSSAAMTNPSITGGKADSIKVVLTAPAVASPAAVVSLSSSDPHVVVPPTVTVSALSSSQTFPITTSAVASKTVATITATMGAVTKTCKLTLN